MYQKVSVLAKDVRPGNLFHTVGNEGERERWGLITQVDITKFNVSISSVGFPFSFLKLEDEIEVYI